MSEFWMRKMRTYFHHHDVDRDGVITAKDFSEMSVRFCDRENVDDPARRQTIRKHFDDVFRKFTYGVEARQGEVVLTEQGFVETMRNKLRDPGVMKAIDALYRGLFNVMDVNEDGYLQAEEYRRFFENMGVTDTTFTKEAFESIDVDHDGKLSIEEFVKAAMEFLLSEDETSPTVLMWGPLVG